MLTTGKAIHHSMKRPSRLIALYSPTPQCGKSTAAKWLWTHGFTIVSFANPVRNMAINMLMSLGYNEKQAYELVTTRKHEVIPELGVTGRHILRKLGTEFGRDLIHPDLWVMCSRNALRTVNPVANDDLRFPNEFDLIKELGGEAWRVTSERPGFVPPDASHASDGLLEGFPFDRHLRNDGTLAEFHSQVLDALNAYYGQNPAQC